MRGKSGAIIFYLNFLLGFSFWTSVPLAAQDKPFVCGTDEVVRKQIEENTLIKANHKQIESKILAERLSQRSYRTEDVTEYTIPVVVHIVHNNGTENISDAQVLAGIQHLNEAFNNLGLFTTTSGTVTGIKFCLAKQDEDGNLTAGITRTVSSLTNMLSPSQDLPLKNLIRWDPTKYINIWLVNEVTSESAGAGVAGYAYFPSSHGTAADGVVCEARYFGSTVDNSKVHIHELGHYFGLYHTFEGSCTNNNCLVDGDRVCDTPPDASVAPTLCPAAVNTCTSDSDDLSVNNPFRPLFMGGQGDQNDLTNNYMDYGTDLCRIAFTMGQKDRMLSALTLVRKSLLQSSGCENPCPSPIQLSFTPNDTTVVLGAQVNFTNHTTGATNYQWQIDGTPFSNSFNPSYVFNQQGKHTISLIATNGNNICTTNETIEVLVKCSTKASFLGPQKMKPGEVITFTNTTVGGIAFEWLLDGAPLSTSQDLVYTFTATGGFMIGLVAFNGSCYDTLKKFIQVGSCNPGNEGRNWQFGDWAGVRFSEDSVYAVTFPLTVPRIFLRSEEGCVSMSDASGKFLFFSSPQYVFNRNLFQMPNGSGLLGDFSATQIAALAKPGAPNLYYLFTLDAFGGPDGLRYSEIDMSLDGGLGDVVPASKNTLIINSVTEKITTVKHANGMDSWVIVHEYNTDAFFSFLISSTGVTMTPVISHTGTVHLQDIYNQNAIGQLKASPDGCKLALAISGMSTIELFNFNNLTGAVSNPLTFTGPDYLECYGVEFSPDGSKLYVGIESLKNIYQFDLNAGNSAAIQSSRYLVANVGTTGYLGSLQIGPFGKIYAARNGTHFLGIIENPNAVGVNCNYVNDGINLGIRTSSSSLPSFNQSYFYDPTPVIVGPDTVCANSKNIPYRISGSTCSASLNAWSLKGKAVFVSVSDSVARLDFNGSGVDTLIVERTAACGKTCDTLRIVVKNPPILNIKDTVQCAAAPVVLFAGSGFVSYRWQDNSTLSTFTASSPGKYWVTATANYGCSVTDTVNVLLPSAPTVSLGPDTVLCKGSVLILNAGSGHVQYDWQDHFSEQTYSVFLPGKYWVTVTDQCSQKGSDTILIAEKEGPTISLGTQTEICANETVMLNAGKDYKNYIWQDGSGGQTFTVSSKGSYWVIAINEKGCFGSDTIVVKEKADCCTGIMIPNLITLNNDGVNDKFILTCAAFQGWTVEVYNRWGDLVFASKDYKNEWPVDAVHDGVYYYLVKKDGNSYRGWVQVVR